MSLRTLLILILALVALAGCGDDDDAQSTGGGGGDGGGELAGASLTVGSKEFTEQLILGQITIKVLENAGAEVTDQTGLEGSVAAREALTAGEVDMYWEYTGTAWINYLGNEEPVPDAQQQFQQVQEADLQENGIVWLEPAPLNNTYAFAVRSDAGPELDQVQTLSDVAQLVQTNPELATLCVGEEFATRPDGLPGVEEAYGFEFPKDQVSLVGDAVVYDQVASGDRCNFGSVFSTDGKIQANNLRVLEDDKSFFPFFNAALTVREQVMTENPAIEQLFAPVSEALTNEAITGLNARVDVEGETPADVAQDFLEQNGLLG